jgi:hypothetical protein
MAGFRAHRWCGFQQGMFLSWMERFTKESRI